MFVWNENMSLVFLKCFHIIIHTGTMRVFIKKKRQCHGKMSIVSTNFLQQCFDHKPKILPRKRYRDYNDLTHHNLNAVLLNLWQTCFFPVLIIRWFDSEWSKEWIGFYVMLKLMKAVRNCNWFLNNSYLNCLRIKF